MRSHNIPFRLVLAFMLLVVSIPLSFARASAMSQYVALSPGESVSSLINTPYPTLTPIGVTSTPVNPLSGLDRTCPVGVPGGYGLLTPSDDWLMMCGSCLPTFTPQTFNTSTPGSTHTPVFDLPTAVPQVCMTASGGGAEVCYTTTPGTTTATAGTPSITATTSMTPTSTPGATATLSPGGFTCYNATSMGNRTCTVMDNGNRLHFTADFSNCSTTDCGLLKFAGSVSSAYVNGQLDAWVKVTGNFQIVQTCMKSDGTVCTGNRTIRYYTQSFPAGYGWDTGASITANMDLFKDQLLRFTSGVTNFQIVIDPVRLTNVSGINDLFSASIVADVYGRGVGTPTPSPTVTSVGTSTMTPSATPTLDPRYCGSISDVSLPNPFNFSGSGQVVSQTCASTPGMSYQQLLDIIFPSWLSGLQTLFETWFPVSFEINPITVCVRQRDYSLYIFNVRMPIEFIVALGIFLSALRMFVPSVFSGVAAFGNNTPRDVADDYSARFGRDSTGDYGRKK